jgi:hypothetical protein
MRRSFCLLVLISSIHMAVASDCDVPLSRYDVPSFIAASEIDNYLA